MFTICILDQGISGQNGWSSANVLMVSAPANSRSEALDISNTLMKDVLGNLE